jgi:hypothetical protein
VHMGRAKLLCRVESRWLEKRGRLGQPCGAIAGHFSDDCQNRGVPEAARACPGVRVPASRRSIQEHKRMRPIVVDERAEMARAAAESFVAASLACMENPGPDSIEAQKGEHLIERHDALMRAMSRTCGVHCGVLTPGRIRREGTTSSTRLGHSAARAG